MIIQHNLSAMNSHRQLGINNAGTSKNLEKLSSGYKVNRAGDDAAGLAISEKMRGQIRGLTMANQNAQNGVSLIQTAEGGLNETHSILQRMRELAVQSANGTYMDDVDRENIAKEVQALKSEVDRIASATHYNGIKLLDGTMGGQTVKAMNAVDAANGDAANTTLVAMLDDFGLHDYLTTLTLDGDYVDKYAGQEATLIIRTDGNGNSSIAMQIGDKTYSMATLDDRTAAAAQNPAVALAAGRSFFEIDADGNYNLVAGLSDPFVDTDVKSTGVVKVTFSGQANVAGDEARFDNDTTIIATDKSQLVFQIGANGTADQRVGLHVDNMSTGFLGKESGQVVHDISVGTRELANDAIKTLDAAINQVSGTRADLGALQNRLEHTINNLGTTTENLQAAESTIRDVDMAKEMMEFTKNNILVQASQSMLAQANQLPQGVLQLLR